MMEKYFALWSLSWLLRKRIKIVVNNEGRVYRRSKQNIPRL